MPLLTICLQINIIMNIKCLLYARYTTSIPINVIVNDLTNRALSAEIDRIPHKIKGLKSRSGEKDKFRTSYGIWYVTHDDDSDVSYAVCACQNYLEKNAYKLIEQLQEKIGEINHCEYQTQENIKHHTKDKAINLVAKYNNLSQSNKSAETHTEAEGLKVDLHATMANMSSVEPQPKIQKKPQKKVQKKKKSIIEQVEQRPVDEETTDEQKLMASRNCKLRGMFAMSILCFIGFLIIIIVKATKNQ